VTRGFQPGGSPDVTRAAEVLRAGGLVAFPTETVYGLGADAGNDAAVRRIFAVKGRPEDHPLIVHVASAALLDAHAAQVPRAARLLAEALWPGPLTLLVERSSAVSPVVTGGRSTVGLRVPAHPLALALLDAFGGGIAAPSANRFGRVSPTTASHVVSDLGADVDLVLDGGPCPVGVESTIVDCTVDPPMILRHGGVPAERLDALLGRAVQRVATGPSRASGMLDSHYAPRCGVELVPDRPAADERVQELVLEGRRADVLDPGPDAETYARHLYAWLRDADARGLDVLVAVPPPAEGLGAAVIDRLRKAASPRTR
jgi:L-threonylcarbamoyladenylate synthase